MCQDIAADGSRIEGSHKGWNGLQRAFASGLEMWLALASDFVLRRNIRIAYRLQGHSSHSAFISTTHGCHHLRLCNAINQLYNTLIEKEAARGVKIMYIPRTLMKNIDSGETFGLVRSENALTFSGLWEIKNELDDEDKLNDALSDPGDMLDSAIATELNLNPASFYRPLLASCLPHDTHISTSESACFFPTHSSLTALTETAAPALPVDTALPTYASTALRAVDLDIDPQLHRAPTSAFTFEFPASTVIKRTVSVSSATSVPEPSTMWSESAPTLKEELPRIVIVSHFNFARFILELV